MKTRTMLFSLVVLTATSQAQVVFKASFESPVVTGFVERSLPDNERWVGAAKGYGCGNRGLYNESVEWPDTPTFTTPYGDQAYLLNYTNSGITTAQGAIPVKLSLGERYTVTFNTAVLDGATEGSCHVELVAFDPGHDNKARGANRELGTVLATATGPVSSSDFSETGSLSFTPEAGDASLGKELGIRILKAGNEVLYDNVRLIVGHDYAPTPADGEDLFAAGKVKLQWTNLTAQTKVDILLGTDPDDLKAVVSGKATENAEVAAPTAGIYYWRVDSYPVGKLKDSPVSSDVFSFTIADTDGDGLPDAYELTQTDPQSNTALDPDSDLDKDELSALDEYRYGTDPGKGDTDGDGLLDGKEMAGLGQRPVTDPKLADTDGDGLSDGVETNTGKWTSASDTGTDPTDPDRDKDGLVDGVETNDGNHVDASATGTDPYNPDTDSDQVTDWYEAVAAFTDPTDASAKPPLPYPLPDPDSSTGATDKPVKVYIMSGQSNMVGFGKVKGDGNGTLETMVKRQNKFPNLLGDDGEWTTRPDVRYRGVVSDIADVWLSPGNLGPTFGPELGFGYIMGWYHDEPVLLIKSSIGNRALGWDILPKGSPSYDYGGLTYAGYGQTPNKWETGSTPKPVGWYAGKEYDRFFLDESEWAKPGDPVENVVDVLDNFAEQYPDWAEQGFEIAGFVWWQGDKDRYDMGLASRYEQNLVKLIDSLRNYYSERYPGKVVSNAPFVLATLGQTGHDSINPEEKAILEAQLAVDGSSGKYPKYQGNVKTVYTHPISHGGASNAHYGKNAATYLLVGDALGAAMLELLDDPSPPAASAAEK